MKNAFITGAAGFIGFHLAKKLLSNNWNVVGLDALTDYYDVNLKKDRNKILLNNENYISYIGFLEDRNLLNKICEKHNPNIIIHLAAQAGVRYSIKNPRSYVESNLIGTFNILELSKKYLPDHLLIASTSSVYGNNNLPFHENQKCDEPISFYAATKKSNELMAHSYSHLFGIPTTIFRFFTVYGPWGRPDMALYKFTKKILSGEYIEVYNNGDMKRDFTNVNDLVEAVKLLIDVKPRNKIDRSSQIDGDSISESAPFRVVNIGNEKQINLLDYINEIEKNLGIIGKKKFIKMQAGDIKSTLSSTKLLKSLTGFKPKIDLKKGISDYINWYKSYYN